MKSMSCASTRRLKSQRRPHSSPCVSGTSVIWRSFGMSISACSSRTGSSTKNGSKGSITLHHAHGVVEVEPLMQVDAPVAVGPHGLPDVAAVLLDAAHDGAGVEHRANRHVAGPHAERAVPGLHRRSRALLQAERCGVRYGAGGTRAAGGVALAVVTRGAAEQFVHGQAERLALDVPQGEIQRAEGVRLLTARRVEPGDVGFLPDPLDVERVLADERASATCSRVSLSPPSPMPVMPMSVSTVATMLLWLNNGLRLGGR